jgi:hypothetical protein
VHQIHDLVVHVQINHLSLINVRGCVPLVYVRHLVSLPSSELHQHIALFQSCVPETN